MNYCRCKIIVVWILLFFSSKSFSISNVHKVLSVKLPYKPSYVGFDHSNDQVFFSTFGDQKYLGYGGLFSIATPLREFFGKLNSVTLQGTDLTTVAGGMGLWANHVSKFSDLVTGKRGWAIPTGFFVPGTKDGLILKCGSTTNCINQFGYAHRTVETSLNGKQGLLAAFTNRVPWPSLVKQRDTLVFLTHQNGEWRYEHVTSSLKGPQVYFDVLKKEGTETLFVFAAEYFNRALTINRIEAGYQMTRAVVDCNDAKKKFFDTSAIGNPFDVQVVSAGEKKVPYLFVTNHQETQEDAGVFIYKIPEDPMDTEGYRKARILGGIEVKGNFFNLKLNASPGNVLAYHPRVGVEDDVPFLLVSTDAGHSVLLGKPTSKKYPFDYEFSPIVENLDSIVGHVDAVDLDGDGVKEIIVPLFDRREIQIFRPVL